MGLMVKWQLRRNTTRLRALRADVAIIDEQRFSLDEGAHADALERAAEKANAEIRRLELRQDQLLDRLSGS